MTTRVRPQATPARFPDEYGQKPETINDVLDWTEVADRIAGAKNYWMATLRPDGRPHLRPVDGVFVHDTLCFGGSPETRWVRHLQQQPEASASLPDDDHAVILEGRVEVVSDAGDSLAIAVAAANREKYPQYYTGDDAMAPVPFWALRPARVYAWSLTGFPAHATRFDFA